MAVSLAPHNIRVNAIGPGSIMTEVLQAVANNKKDMEKYIPAIPNPSLRHREYCAYRRLLAVGKQALSVYRHAL